MPKYHTDTVLLSPSAEEPKVIEITVSVQKAKRETVVKKAKPFNISNISIEIMDEMDS